MLQPSLIHTTHKLYKVNHSCNVCICISCILSVKATWIIEETYCLRNAVMGFYHIIIILFFTWMSYTFCRAFGGEWKLTIMLIGIFSSHFDLNSWLIICIFSTKKEKRLICRTSLIWLPISMFHKYRIIIIIKAFKTPERHGALCPALMCQHKMAYNIRYRAQMQTLDVLALIPSPLANQYTQNA